MYSSQLFDLVPRGDIVNTVVDFVNVVGVKNILKNMNNF